MKQNKEIKFDFPNKISEIFSYLIKNGARPIVVGGYIRDTILGYTNLKDIDVEVYGIASYETLIALLKPFGNVSFVGKHFGVCTLCVESMRCDFSLPRKETKIARGHKGFAVEIDTNLTFCDAAKRRDFRVNALGYDVKNARLLDCFDGLYDLRNRLLRVIDEERFIQDPLRLYRAGVFYARFALKPDSTLRSICRRMSRKHILAELPKERIFEELKKIFLRAYKPSLAFRFYMDVEENRVTLELASLAPQKKRRTLAALDALSRSSQKELAYFFAALFFYYRDPLAALGAISQNKSLLTKVGSLLRHISTLYALLRNGYDDYALKRLAADVCIDDVTVLARALYPKRAKEIDALRRHAKLLGVLYAPVAKKITGKDLIRLGLRPSKRFATILDTLYDMQLRGITLDDATVKSVLESI